MPDKRPGDPAAESLGFWLFRVHRAMHAAFARRLSDLGVTPAEWHALALAGQGGATPATLADAMGIDRGAATRLVDQLEAKRLVRRRPSPSDGRSREVVLTQRGETLLPRLIETSRAVNQEYLALLPGADARRLVSLVRALGERLPNRPAPDEPE